MVDEVYDGLNDSTSIQFTESTLLLNSDGSNDDGYIQNLEPFHYNDVANRLFSISLSIPPPDYQIVGTSSGTADSGFDTAKSNGDVVTMTDGAPLKKPPSHSTTATFNKLMLLDFYS